MTTLSRRGFVQFIAATVPAATGCATSASQGPGVELDRDTLVALATTVLPEDLSDERVQGVCDQFAAWLAGYRAEAELNHGYGTGEIRHADAHPGPRWAQQLVELDAAAGSGRRFSALDPNERRAIVARHLADVGSDLPVVRRAPHVAVAVLSLYYTSPEATDRCYGVAIGRQRCRSLAQSPDAPADLAESGE